MLKLRVGDEIEITFESDSQVATYEIINKEMKWEMDGEINDINWHIYTVRYIRNSCKNI
jgi:hypothetical protein